MSGRPLGLSFRYAPWPKPKHPSEGTKRERLLVMLLDGASFGAVAHTFGWNRKQAAENIRMLNYHNGYGLWSTSTSGGCSIRIVDADEYARLYMGELLPCNESSPSA